MRAILVLALIAIASIVTSQPAPRERVGPLPGGGFLLPNGSAIHPAGKQVPVDTFPMSAALSPDGRYLLALNGGYNPPSISIIDVAAVKEVSRTPVADGWLGLTFSPKGDRVYLGGGSQASVFEFTYANGALTPGRTFPVVPAEKRTNRDFIGDVAFSPDGRLIYAADLYHDEIAVINPQSGMVIEHYKTGRRPYRILFHPDGQTFFVTSWTEGTVYEHRREDGSIAGRLRLGPHTTDMVFRPGKPKLEEGAEAEGGGVPWMARLFVAASNTNSVYVVGLDENKDMRLVESINVAMMPRQPAGMTPSALALGPDSSRLYIVCSDANAVAVADVRGARTAGVGFVPSGWYPTAVRVLADHRIVVLNGRGLGSKPNPHGPSPVRRPAPAHLGLPNVEYVARIQTGTVSFIDAPTDEQLQNFSERVLADTPYRDEQLDNAGVPKGNPIPNAPGQPGPIEHVIYVVKENRTYDQVLGDMKEGNGDPSLVLFGEQITPNHHKLAREFVLFDNFYVNSDVSADGHNWSTAAIAPDYVQKMWPNSYAGRRKLYDYEGQEPTNAPPAGYLWTNAAAAGLTMRNYGYFVTNRPKADPSGEQVLTVRDPILAQATNRRYRAFDLDYPDVERAKIFLEDLAGFEKSGQMPRLVLLRLPNDHTSGTAAGKIAPLSSAADNDFALGTIIDALSRSRFWQNTAVFVLEDDAQNGPDHVDSHRSPAFVISPWVRRGMVDSTMYNTTSMLRTMELILGLQPMTQFDAGARPMWNAFHAKADTRPYTAEKPRIALDDRNPATAPAAARSARMDFSDADRIDDNELNEILWLAIRGTEPPAPRRSFFGR